MDYEIIPKDELSQAVLRKRFIDRCGDNLDFYIDKLNELAEGVWVFFKTSDGTMTKAYKRPPDIRALTYIKDQLIGKSSEHKFDSANQQSQGIITISNMLKSLANEKRTRLQLNERGSGLDVSERSRNSVYTDADTRENS